MSVFRFVMNMFVNKRKEKLLRLVVDFFRRETRLKVYYWVSQAPKQRGPLRTERVKQAMHYFRASCFYSLLGWDKGSSFRVLRSVRQIQQERHRPIARTSGVSLPGKYCYFIIKCFIENVSKCITIVNALPVLFSSVSKPFIRTWQYCETMYFEYVLLANVVLLQG